MGDDVGADLLHIGGQLFDYLVMTGLVRLQLLDSLRFAAVGIYGFTQTGAFFDNGGKIPRYAGAAFVEALPQVLLLDLVTAKRQLVLTDQLPQLFHTGGKLHGAGIDLQKAFLFPGL